MFGTIYYYDEKENLIGKSRPGMMEGTRVYLDPNGRYLGKSYPGFLAKEVFYDAQNNRFASYEGLFGDVHYKNGMPVGRTTPGLFASAYTTLEVEDENPDVAYYEEDYLQEDLPEEWEDYEDVADYEKVCSPKVTQYTVVKNLQLFVLSLVICMVILCIYAIIKFN